MTFKKLGNFRLFKNFQNFQLLSWTPRSIENMFNLKLYGIRWWKNKEVRKRPERYLAKMTKLIKNVCLSLCSIYR